MIYRLRRLRLSTTAALERGLWVYPLVMLAWFAAGTYILTAPPMALPTHETPVEPERAALTLSEPKSVVYEVRSTSGRPITVSYLDAAGRSRLYTGTSPWRTSLTTNDLAFAAGVTALSTSDTVTCRIRVDGNVADEKSDTGISPSVSCNLIAFQKLSP